MGSTYNVITDGIYDPFDSSIKSYKYGDSANNVNFTKTINKDGLISDITTSVSSNVDKSYSYDTRLNMTAITGSSSSDTASASYDFNSRITNYNYGSGTNDSTYNYNTSSDRTSTVINSATTTYTSASTSHKLDSLSGSVSDTLTYDAAGNQTGSTLGSKTFTYNNAGRMSAYSDSTNSYSYVVNSLGQRVKKIDNNNSANNVNYVYDAGGKLIAEYDDSNNLLNEYIYLNGIPVALLRSTNLYFIYPDHLGTPRTITDTSNNVKWTWENTEPFGNSAPNETVSGSTFKFNLRLPGQYFDNESNLNYNYYRDYNSMLGRYIQSDPIGLNGGFNTYGYVGGNGLSYIDVLGLDPWWQDKNLKRIENSDTTVINWLCKSFGDFANPLVKLKNYRANGFDKYDDNLAAAERFAEMFDGSYTNYEPIKSADLNFLQYSLKILRNTFSNGAGNGSKDANFVAKWGALGAFYQEQNIGWSRWKDKNCDCRK